MELSAWQEFTVAIYPIAIPFLINANWTTDWNPSLNDACPKIFAN